MKLRQNLKAPAEAAPRIDVLSGSSSEGAVVSTLTGVNLQLEVYEGWQLDGVYQRLLRGSPVDGNINIVLAQRRR